MTAALPVLAPGALLAGRFRIVRLLGRGGMGEVYEARHEVLQRRLAIKRMRADALVDPHAEGLFIREARAASRVEHPSVAFVYDFGRDEQGCPYIAMEYVDGPSLEAALAETPKMPVALAVELLGQIAAALAAAHALDVAHLDLKPANVTFDGPVEQRRVKVIDFGLARSLAQDATVESIGDQVRGSPPYMSPEQFLGRQKLDARSDVYSFGVLAFEMLCGCRPFGGNLAQIVMAHQHDPPPPPSSLVKLPAILEALLLECLAKKPDDRPAHGGALVELLGRVALELATPGLQAQPTVAFGATTPLLAPAPTSSPSQRLGAVEMGAPATRHDATLMAGGAGLTMTHARTRALDDLVLALRDRELTRDEIELGAARKARAEDDLLGFEAQRDDLVLQIARARQAHSEREARLRRAYVGLERRVAASGSAQTGGSAQASALRDALDELGMRMRQLDSAAGEHIAQLGARAAGLQRAADEASVEVTRQRALLLEAIRAIRATLPLTDASMLSLLVQAGA